MELLVAFSTDDGKNLSNGHAGDAQYFYLYRFFEDGEKLIEQRKNIDFSSNPALKPGTPEMAKAKAAIFKDLDALVGKKFGSSGLPHLLKKFVCVLVETDAISQAIEVVRDNLDKIKEEKNKGENRKHIVLKQ
jgi:predicted Fe-Mo cluster-binding NifX family protein